METEIICLAAKKATEEEIANIQGSLNKIKGTITNIPEIMEFDREFHIAVRGFEMKFIGYDPFVSQEDVDSAIEVIDDWNRVFKESDFVSLNLPLNNKTRGLLARKSLP